MSAQAEAADPGKDVARAATALPVIEGALALIVIAFIGQVWPHIPPERTLTAFVLVYACGAHFIFSFLVSVPGMVICRRAGNLAWRIAVLVGLFGYAFWSLNEQHRALANLMLDQPWRIPLPLVPELSTLLSYVLGGDSNSLFAAPLVLGWVMMGVAGAVLSAVFAILPKKAGAAKS